MRYCWNITDAQTNAAVQKQKHARHVWNSFRSMLKTQTMTRRVKNLAESVKRCSSDGRVDAPLSALANHQVNNATGNQRSPRATINAVIQLANGTTGTLLDWDTGAEG